MRVAHLLLALHRPLDMFAEASNRWERGRAHTMSGALALVGLPPELWFCFMTAPLE